jgi:ferredoxin
MKEVQTFVANIYLGLKEDYDGGIKFIEEVYDICQQYCNGVGLCVTVSPTRFIYTNGYEDGCCIGFINYPRFPSTNEKIIELAIKLAEILKQDFKQNRVSIVTRDKTYMLE